MSIRNANPSRWWARYGALLLLTEKTSDPIVGGLDPAWEAALPLLAPVARAAGEYHQARWGRWGEAEWMLDLAG